MKINEKLNADRFLGFADVYNEARPQCPPYIVELVKRYQKSAPECVVDLGCGTGLSTRIWDGIAARVIGVEPSSDMIAVAREKAGNGGTMEFLQGFSDDTGLPDGCADAVTCSQSFHWMNPGRTLCEVNRILRPGGVFLTCDCDWPPVCDWQAERAYQALFADVRAIEEEHPRIHETFQRWDKNNHLRNIQNSNYFAYVREIVFASREPATAQRFLSLAMSQGSLQTILKMEPGFIAPQFERFRAEIESIFGEQEFLMDFCYRVRVGVKAP